MLANWTCSINHCINPLEGIGILKDFLHCIQYHTLPAAWIISQKEMGAIKPLLRLCATDKNHIINGDVSISHCFKLIKKHDNTGLDGSPTLSLRNIGFKLVKQLGQWNSVNQIIKFLPHNLDKQLPTRKKPTIPMRRNWDKATNALSLSNIHWFFNGSSDLLIPRLQCCENTERYIVALAHTCKFAPSSCDHNKATWATDRSMSLAASSVLHRYG
jgi:hypothetical protein